MIIELGEWVRNEACRQRTAWRAIGLDIQVAFNLSARPLGEAAVPAFMSAPIGRHRIAADAIKLEVTESMLVQHAELVTDALNHFKRREFSIALDDFGTGYSNFARIHQYPVDVIKIDRSFIDGVGKDADAEKVLRTIVALGQLLNFIVVCEGIETPYQLQRLARSAVTWAWSSPAAVTLRRSQAMVWSRNAFYRIARSRTA